MVPDSEDRSPVEPPIEEPVDPEVMASVDGTSSPEFIIADISRDEAWLSMRETDAPALHDWC